MLLISQSRRSLRCLENWRTSVSIHAILICYYAYLTQHSFHVLAIEDDYKGPQLEDGKVTLKFMKDLMEHYKAQKRLHRKFAYKVSSIK